MLTWKIKKWLIKQRSLRHCNSPVTTKFGRIFKQRIKLKKGQNHFGTCACLLSKINSKREPDIVLVEDNEQLLIDDFIILLHNSLP